MSQGSSPCRGRVAVSEVHVGGALESGGDDHKRHPANAEHTFSPTITTCALLLTRALDLEPELNLLALSGCHSDASMCWRTTPRRRGDYSLFKSVIYTSLSAPASTFTLDLNPDRGFRYTVACISRTPQRHPGSADPESKFLDPDARPAKPPLAGLSSPTRLQPCCTNLAVSLPDFPSCYRLISWMQKPGWRGCRCWSSFAMLSLPDDTTRLLNTLRPRIKSLAGEAAHAARVQRHRHIAAVVVYALSREWCLKPCFHLPASDAWPARPHHAVNNIKYSRAAASLLVSTRRDSASLLSSDYSISRTRSLAGEATRVTFSHAVSAPECLDDDPRRVELPS
ncbi:hypothetical protein BDZ89DRAFT_1136076 [Hymenopellis radicata]|nr:hypothetical protein BDZ89DRAFT_1136076 [Hymenopellis radicata]